MLLQPLLPDDGIRHPGNARHGAYIMDADDIGPVHDAHSHSGGSSLQPLPDRQPSQDVTNRPFARGPDHDWLPQRTKLAQPPEHFQVLLDRFAESEPRIDQDTIVSDAGGQGKLDAFVKKLQDLGHDAGMRRVRGRKCGASVAVHQHDRGFVLCHDGGHSGIRAQCADIIDHCRARLQRAACHPGFHRINRHNRACFTDQSLNGRENTV